MRQEDVPLGEPVCPSQLGPYLLPVMWQLYPGRRYRGSDSSFWRIVYHIEASVCFSGDPPGHRGWPCSPSPMSGLCGLSVPSISVPEAKKMEGLYKCRFLKDQIGETLEANDQPPSGVSSGSPWVAGASVAGSPRVKAGGRRGPWGPPHASSRLPLQAQGPGGEGESRTLASSSFSLTVRRHGGHAPGADGRARV